MRIVITIGIALFIPLAALMTVLSAPVCSTIAEATIQSDSKDPAEHEFLVSIAMAVRDFSLGNDAAAMPTGEDYRTSITPDALSHLLDVRVVFLAAVYAFLVVLVALVILVVLAVRGRGARALARPLIIGGAVPLVASIVLGLAIAIDFSAFFTWMHGLFFASGTWTFPYDSLLIRALPFEFWVGCAVVWAATMALLCIASIIGGVLIMRRDSYRENSLPK